MRRDEKWRLSRWDRNAGAAIFSWWWGFAGEEWIFRHTTDEPNVHGLRYKPIEPKYGTISSLVNRPFVRMQVISPSVWKLDSKQYARIDSVGNGGKEPISHSRIDDLHAAEEEEKDIYPH